MNHADESASGEVEVRGSSSSVNIDWARIASTAEIIQGSSDLAKPLV